MLERVSLRVRLVGGLLFVVLIPGLTATLLGVHFIDRGIIAQAQSKVGLDLNTAREIYEGRIREIKTVMEFSAIRPSIWNSLKTGDDELLRQTMTDVYTESGLDVLNIADAGLKVVFRCGAPDLAWDNQSHNVIAAQALDQAAPVGGTQIVDAEALERDGRGLAGRAFMKIVPTPQAVPTRLGESRSGMMMMAAAPVFDEAGGMLGVIYGGDLLNRRYEIVDRIKDIVYRGERYKGRDIGTSTIFQGDMRVSTNVLTEAGKRAIGTRVSRDVHHRVLVEGREWIDRAFVVNSWYITAYEPIRDVSGNVVGMLYVGMLEEPYQALAWRIIWIFLSLTGVGIMLALVVSYFLSRSILLPISALSEGAQRLAQGELNHRIGVLSDDEIGELGRTFNLMASSLKERDEKLKEHAQRRIMESERLATIGQLAAGVAHEINNPLGGILVFSHLLLEDADENDPKRTSLEKIANEAMRCKEIIRGLLDFARQTEPKTERVNVNHVLERALSLLERQPLFHNIRVHCSLARDLPEVMADMGQLEQVFVNLILNAAEAMQGDGDLKVSSMLSEDARHVAIEFSDTGCGIAEENIERLFEPFFTTKEVGHGTGLGLSISHGIIQRHSGTIEVRSEIGVGTAFVIRFPTIPCDKQSQE